MRGLLITLAVVVVVGAVVLVGVSVVQWRGNTPQDELGPSEAQQNRAQEQAVQKNIPPQQLNETQIRRYQEKLEAEGFSTGPDKGTITPQTEAALRAYQHKYGLPPTGELDEATQRSLVAGQMPTPGKAVEGQSVPRGTAPQGSPR
jgi:peptidoglycan hydrolase-like protein with peptidoglycan-binding domain